MGDYILGRNVREDFAEKAKRIQCKACNKVIFSSYSGEWVKCDCKKDFIYIDQTEFYIRMGGEREQMIFLGE